MTCPVPLPGLLPITDNEIYEILYSLVHVFLCNIFRFPAIIFLLSGFCLGLQVSVITEYHLRISDLPPARTIRSWNWREPSV